MEDSSLSLIDGHLPPAGHRRRSATCQNPGHHRGWLLWHVCQHRHRHHPRRPDWPDPGTHGGRHSLGRCRHPLCRREASTARHDAHGMDRLHPGLLRQRFRHLESNPQGQLQEDQGNQSCRYGCRALWRPLHVARLHPADARANCSSGLARRRRQSRRRHSRRHLRFNPSTLGCLSLLAPHRQEEHLRQGDERRECPCRKGLR